MPETVWINAWIISSVLSAGVLVLVRRSGLTWGESLLLALASFPAPLMYVLRGRNSLVYPIDFAIPFAIHLGLSAGHRAAARLMDASIASPLRSLVVKVVYLPSL